MRISDWSSDVCSSDLLLFIGAREVDRRFAFLPRRGDFLERLVDLARRIDLADRDALDQNAGAILVEQLLHPLLDLRLDFDAPRTARLNKVEIGDRRAHRAFGDFQDRTFRNGEVEE